MNNFLEKDESGSLNSIPPIPSEKLKNVNCHKFTLYAMGKITWEEMISDPLTQKEEGIDFTFGNRARLISDMPYIRIRNENDLRVLTDKSCEIGKVYVGQVLDIDTQEMAHSFVVKRTSENEYVCFEKPGFKYPFAICHLNTILNFVNKDGERSNMNQDWRFVPFA